MLIIKNGKNILPIENNYLEEFNDDFKLLLLLLLSEIAKMFLTFVMLLELSQLKFVNIF